MERFDELLEQVQKHLECSVQSWFFGAGISHESNVPLMHPLTTRVETLVDVNEPGISKEIYAAIKDDLPKGCHIEHVLSHIGDLLALAERSANSSANLAGSSYTRVQLTELYRALIKHISVTIRYGYKAPNQKDGIEELIGTFEEPIVEVEHHRRFLRALFNSRANLERRSQISFFTINYDTLLEDALSLERKPIIDGFSGGAMGFWNPEDEFIRPDKGRSMACRVYKLHGSVDWYRDEDNALIRSRYGVKYLADPAQVLIYPQATKYVETQKDPFASLFLGMRQALSQKVDNVFVVCGYSFGDSHINSEIDSALNTHSNKTTILIFARDGGAGLPKTITDWLSAQPSSERTFVCTERGIYSGSNKREDHAAGELNWWSFRGLIDFLERGASL